MSIFNLTDSPPPFTRRSAGRAWGSSMLLPGTGQLYCGAPTRGWAMLVCTVGGIVASIFFSEAREIAFRVLIVFYVLAPVDAYFTACEHNAGIDAEAPNNPRVAALLNMTTNGFGYRYVGHRTAFGLVFVSSIVLRAIYATQPLLVELFMTSIAVHAWKLATHERETDYPAEQRTQVELSTFPSGVPIAVAALIIGHYWLVVVIAQFVLWRS